MDSPPVDEFRSRLATLLRRCRLCLPLTEGTVEQAAAEHDLTVDDLYILNLATAPDKFLDPNDTGEPLVAWSRTARVEILRQRDTARKRLYNASDVTQGMGEDIVQKVSRHPGNGSDIVGQVGVEAEDDEEDVAWEAEAEQQFERHLRLGR